MSDVKMPAYIVLQYFPLPPLWRAGSAVELLTDDPGKILQLTATHISDFSAIDSSMSLTILL